jgi:hypothetical protein
MSLSDPSTGSIFFPSIFETRKIETNGATIHTRVGGQGPAVISCQGQAHYARARYWRRSCVRSDDGDCDARCCHQRAGSNRSRLRTLDYGGEPSRNHETRYGLLAIMKGCCRCSFATSVGELLVTDRASSGGLVTGSRHGDGNPVPGVPGRYL